VMLGASSRDLKLEKTITLAGKTLAATAH
jgi:hypothetical protein